MFCRHDVRSVPYASSREVFIGMFRHTTKDSLSSSELIITRLGFRRGRVVVSSRRYPWPDTVSGRNTHTSCRRNRARKGVYAEGKTQTLSSPLTSERAICIFSFLAPTAQHKDSMPECFRLFIGIHVTTNPWMIAYYSIFYRVRCRC